jgi:CBS domain containing-hemolysin-like protein
MQSVSADATKEEIVKLIDECGYSRIPVYDESFEKITGILHSRDFLLQNAKGSVNMDEVVRKPVYVPETAPLDALFKDMQENHLHIVIVIDEYGDTAGLVTMEDILEEIVGEIWDEQDEEFSNIEKIDECSYKVLTNVTIDEFFAFFELDFDDEIESTTVNGWIAERCGAIPEKDFSFDYENITVTVTKADELRSYEIVVSVRECAKKDAECEADTAE